MPLRYCPVQQCHVVFQEVRQIRAVLREQDVGDGIKVRETGPGDQVGKADFRKENVSCPEKDYL